ncbi:unnamed protein product [Penicillium salamii]|uniref:Enoyl reductase (ER) domain-containing protein n=1 Tax=Penicillium salamii TaxID=1612424 RepID=A0A9W4IZT6_9EURO|nr:unnamed protein product [Penicillium salamii]
MSNISSAGHDLVVFMGSPEGKVIQKTSRRDLHDDEVLIQVTHSGVCGTDVHFRDQPIGLGHEGAGIIQAVGRNCQRLKAGDRVGWGYCHNEAYVFRIPDQIDLASAAPLMCGGATVFGTFHRLNVKPSDTVGILGLGGLGHLAVQFSKSFGCNTIALSDTLSKKESILELGAHQFFSIADLKNGMKPPKLQHLIVTASVLPSEWDHLIPLLDTMANIAPLRSAPEILNIPAQAVVFYGFNIVGTIIASRAVHNQMLEFAALHGIKPLIEEYPMTVDGIEKALNALGAGEVRYRAVLKS